MVNLFLSWRDKGRGKGGKRGRISRTAACIIVSKASSSLSSGRRKFSEMWRFKIANKSHYNKWPLFLLFNSFSFFTKNRL